MITILIGVDASERSEDAVAFSRALARHADVELVVANAYPYEPVGRAANAEFRRVLQEDAEATVRRLSASLAEFAPDRLRMRTVASTSPAHALHDLVEAEHADLVVLGSSDTGRLGRVLPGSTGERLLHGAPCPVAVVPLGYRSGDHQLRRIGVAYDGSQESEAAVRVSRELSRASGAQLFVIRVQPVALGIGSDPAAAMYAYVEDDPGREARQQVERMVAELDVEAFAAFREGDPAKELASCSEELDLLVTGSRRYGPLRSVLLGGVSGPLLRMAACPVIVIPRGVQTALGDLAADDRTAMR